jgi:hypothetical protein
MVPFGKQQEVLRDLCDSHVQKSGQEAAGRLLIEDGVGVISNEKSACVLQIQSTWT